jgi:hypothetical protein
VPENGITSKLTLNIPFVRAAGPNGSVSTQAWSGNLYIKIYNTDPTRDSKGNDISGSAVNAIIPGQLTVGGTTYGVEPDATNTDDWDTSDQEYWFAKFEINSDCCAKGDNAWTYATIGAASLIQCGGPGGGRNFSGTCDYDYDDIGVGSVSITDNYNNTFTVTATRGSNSTYNTATAQGLWVAQTRTNGNWNWGSEDKTNTTKTVTLSISDESAENKEVAAWLRTYSQYTNSNGYKFRDVSATTNIKQYVGPSAPSDLTINYTKSRFTIKENWTLRWTAATRANKSSPIKGYRIRLYRKRGTGSFEKIHIKGSTGNNLSTADDKGDIYYDRGGTNTSLTIYPAAYGTELQPGDIIKFSVAAYTKYGKNNDGDQLFKVTGTFSGQKTIRNAGIVRVKVDKAWKEGQVYVKVNNDWKEAEYIKVKTADGWEESE